MSALFNSSPSSMILIGENFQIIAINKQAKEESAAFLGCEIRVGEYILPLVEVFRISNFERHFKEALTGKLITIEQYYNNLNGQEKWLEYSYIPVHENTDKPSIVCLSIQNITSHKKTEDLFNSNVTVNQTIQECIPDMIFQIKRDGTFLNFKAGDQSNLLLEPNYFIGRNAKDVLPPEIANRTIEYLEKTFETGKLQIFEYELVLEGTTSFFEARIVVSSRNEALIIARDITERKQVEKALRRYRLLSENTLDIILFIKPDGTILEANRAAAQAYGYSIEELQALNIRDLRASEILTQVTVQMQRAGTEGILFETNHRRKDGNIFPVEVSSHGIDLDNERVLLSVIRDISERKQSEYAVKESEASYRELADSITDVFYAFDSDLRFTYWNKAMALITGISADTALGKKYFDIFPDEPLRRKSFEFFCETLKTQHATSFQNQYNNKIYEYSVYPTKSGIAVFSRDITENYTINEVLREKEELYRSVISAMSEGVVIQGKDGAMIASNKSAEKFLPLSKNTLERRTANDTILHAIHEDGSPFPKETHPAMVTLRTGEKCSGVIMGLQMADTSVSWISINTNPLFHSDGVTIRGVVSSFTDITQQRQMEESLRRSEELYRTLVYSLPGTSVVLFDHELRILVASGDNVPGRSFTGDTVEGKTLYEVVSNTGVARIEPYYKAALSGIELTEEYKFRDKTFLLRSTPVRNAQNEIFAGMLLVFDVTALKKAEQAQHESEDRFRSVINNVTEVIFQTDAAGLWTFLNPAWHEITDFTLEESIGQNFLDYVHPDDRERNTALFIPLIERKKEYCRHQVRYLTKSGGFRWIEVYARLTLDDENTIVGTSGTLRDITEQRLAEEALQYRLEFEQILASISTSFINLGIGEIEEEMHNALVAASHFAGADRSYICIFSEDGKQVIQTYEWCALGIQPTPETHKIQPITAFPWLMSRIKRLESLNLGSLVQLPENAKAEKALLESLSIKSTLIVPIAYQLKPIGFLGFDNILVAKSRSDNDIRLLKMISEIFANAIKRKSYESQIVEQRDFAQLVMNTMGQGLTVSSDNDRFDFVNPAYASMLGYSPDELIGKRPSDLTDSADRPKLKDAFNHRRFGEISTYENRLICKDGSIRYVTITSVPVMKEGQLKNIIAVITDLTERKKAEEALRESEQRLRTVVSNVPLILFAMDTNGIITLADGRGFKDLGIEPNIIVGNSIKNSHPSTAEDIRKALDGQFVNTTLELGKGIFEFWYIPIKDQYNRVSSIIGVALNITERIRAEQELVIALEKEKELNNLKSSFVSMASHEFRTPLTTILSSSELLENYGHRLTKERNQELYQRINHAVKNMTQLIDEVLLINRAEAGKLDFNPDWFDMSVFSATVIEEIQLGLGIHHRFDLNISAAPQLIKADEKLLRQVVSNLVTNAIKYSKSGSIVYIELVYKSDKVIFTVRDEGIGIPPEGLKHLYEVFYRAPNVGSIQGTGLGLAIVKRCLDLHNGTIDIMSEQGKSTTCIATIPLSSEKAIK
ncbi:PAS domain S-box protein [Candidatus Chlorohelix sp.]|uniref:PAS domain S-box protein n=1 Tax=Candidatus Chlorohelix sp. TaxID=3139201 RepID=UPI003059E809